MVLIPTSRTSLLDPQADLTLVRFFWVASFIFTLVGVSHLVTHLRTDPVPIWRVGMSVALIVVGLVTNVLLLRRRYLWSFELMVWGGWLITTAVTVVSGGIHSPNLMIYPLLIIAASWLLSVRTGLIFAGLSLLAVIGLALAQATGHLPAAQKAPLSVAATTAAAMVMAAALCAYFFARSYTQRYEEMHRLGLDLQRSQAQLAYVLTVARESVWNWDIPRDTVTIDDNWNDILGLAPNGHAYSLEYMLQLVHEGDRERVRAGLEQSLRGGGPYRSEHRMLHANGKVIWVRNRGDVFERDAQGQPLRMIGSIAEITERKQMEEQIHRLAFYDTLTALPNRRLFQDRLGQALATARRGSHCGALMVLDLDNFKPLNDAHGHAAGDLLLMEVARRLKGCVRESDTVARLGGDEFVVILAELRPDLDDSLAMARPVAEKIRATLAAPYSLQSEEAAGAGPAIEHQCSASIGVALFDAQHTDAEALLRQADAAMYQAKQAGRNQIHFHGEAVVS